MTPKNIHKILIHKKYSFFWKPPKILKFKILNPKKWPEPTYVWKYQSNPPGRQFAKLWHQISLSLQPLTKSVMPSKRKAVAKSKQSPDPRARVSPVPCPVSCPVVSDDVQFKLQISNLKSLDIIQDALHKNSLLKMIFNNDTSVFILVSCVSGNPIRYECPRILPQYH